MEIKFNEDEIRREIRGKVPGIYELRILMTDFYQTKLSAYFDSEKPDAVIEQMLKWRYPSGCCINWYLTSNPCKDYCFAMEQFGSLRKAKVMSGDEDIDRLQWLALDIDAKHPAGTCATDAEKKAAHDQAVEIFDYMTGCGFSAPEIVDSGNGYHLKYRIDLPNDNEGRSFLASMVDGLHKLYPYIDTAVKNPARILKLPGTMAMKGRNITEEIAAKRSRELGRTFEARPYRMARIIREAGREEDHAE